MVRVSARARVGRVTTHLTSGMAARLGLVGTLSLLVIGYAPGAATAATFSAVSHVMPSAMYLDDTAKPLTLAVRNTGTTFIGSVQIQRPGAAWTIDGCTAGPAGWSTAGTPETCIYISQPGNGDDIAPGATRFFAFEASAQGGTQNRSGTWVATVGAASNVNQPGQYAQTTDDGKGMKTTAFAFELISVSLYDESVPAGLPCPPGGDAPAPGSANHILVVCGRNRTTQTLTPRAAQADLVGNFLTGHGPFSSGAIAPTGANVVLGSWSGVSVTSNSDVAHTVAPRIGAASNKTSPYTPFNGFGTANQPPQLQTSEGSMAFTEGNPRKVIDGGITIADPDDTHLERATIKIAGGRHPGDQLGFVSTPAIRASFGSQTGVLVLTGHDTVANYQAALRNVTFWTTNDNPGTSRQIVFKVNDGQTTSNAAQRSIVITPVNDAPVVTTTLAPLDYPENGLEPLDDAFTVTDADSLYLNRATIQVTNHYFAGEDILGFVNKLGITGSWNSTTGTLTLAGTSSVANYQTALRSVSYTNASDSPEGTKTVTFQVRDAQNALSVPKTRTINLIPTNDPPVVTTSAGATSYAVADQPVAIDSAIEVTDADSPNLQSATVSIISGFTGGDQLGFAATPGLTGSYDAEFGVLTLTGVTTVADWQQILRYVTFSTNNYYAAGTSRTITFRVTDTKNSLSNTAGKIVDISTSECSGATAAGSSSTNPAPLCSRPTGTAD